MRKNMISAVIAAMTVLPAAAQINSPEAEGYITRGVAMYADANYNGCIDQMLQVRQLSPDGRQAEDALYYLAMATMGLGDDEALPLLESFLARYPQSVRRQNVLMTIGDFFFTRGSYGEAIRRYRKVDVKCLDADAADDYRYRMAYSYMMLGEYDSADALFSSLEKSPAYANAARFYQAYIAYCRQEYPRALQLFKMVDTSAEPGNTADYYIAQLYFLQGNYREALEAARRIIATDPLPDLTVEARRIAGESLYNLGNPADAIPYLWQYVAAATDPQPSAWYILGVEEFNNRDYGAAAKLLQQAVNADNAMGQNAYLYLGQCYLKLGNNNSALMAFENAYRMNYDPKVQETAFYNYAVARSEGGRAPFSSSVAVMEDFLSQYPNSRYATSIEEYLVNGYMTDDDYPGALAAINKIINPSDQIMAAKQRVLFVLGTREATSGQNALALAHLEEATAIPQGDPSISRQAILWMGDCYYAEEDWTKAAEYYQKYLGEDGDSAANSQLAWYNLGYCRYNQHDYTGALADLSRACSTSGSLTPMALADAHDRMGDCYSANGDFADAAAQYQKAYDIDPSTGDYPLYRLAMMKGHQGNHTQQIQLLDRLMDNFPTSAMYPAALLAKAEAYIAEGNTSKAISTYNRLVRDFPQSSYGRNGLLQLAITYNNSGNRSQAMEAYRKVIYTYPTSEEARLASEDLKRLYAATGNLGEYMEFMNSIPNAPEVDRDEIEALAYDTAEQWYLDDKGTDKLAAYLRDYPNGAFKPQALYYMAEDAEDKGRYQDAFVYATNVVMTYPDSDVAEEALAIKASCELHEGKGEIALASYRQLEEKASTPAMLNQARLQIMRVARDLGDYSTVIEAADKLLGSSATGGNELSEIHFTHAQALYNLGRVDEADKEWSQLARDLDDLYGAKSAYYMAQGQFDRGLVDKAEKSVTKLVDSNSSHDYWRARGVILLSDILRKQGNAFEADQYLRAIRNNYSDKATSVEIISLVDSRLNKQ